MARYSYHLLSAAGVFLVILLGAVVLGSPSALAASPPDDTAHTICKGDVLRAGEVIEQQWSDWFECHGGLWNPNNIQLVAPTGLTALSEVCSDSPVPDGFVIIHEVGSSDACHSAAMTIQPLALLSGSALPICAKSPIPIGWLTVGEFKSDPHVDNADCPLESQSGLVRKLIQLPGNAPITVCADSYIPSDFQEDSVTVLSSSCAQDQGDSLLIEPSVGGPIVDPTQ